ncbi:hypothetical protein HDU76_005041 [Blyttiomyces sp. JEL0837]|nr:hypothetical protein HDU76_005041 [Blyttiomyces sp. JEL0837]
MPTPDTSIAAAPDTGARNTPTSFKHESSSATNPTAESTPSFGAGSGIGSTTFGGAQTGTAAPFVIDSARNVDFDTARQARAMEGASVEPTTAAFGQHRPSETEGTKSTHAGTDLGHFGGDHSLFDKMASCRISESQHPSTAATGHPGTTSLQTKLAPTPTPTPAPSTTSTLTSIEEPPSKTAELEQATREELRMKIPATTTTMKESSTGTGLTYGDIPIEDHHDRHRKRTATPSPSRSRGPTTDTDTITPTPAPSPTHTTEQTPPSTSTHEHEHEHEGLGTKMKEKIHNVVEKTKEAIGIHKKPEQPQPHQPTHTTGTGTKDITEFEQVPETSSTSQHETGHGSHSHVSSRESLKHGEESRQESYDKLQSEERNVAAGAAGGVFVAIAPIAVPVPVPVPVGGECEGKDVGGGKVGEQRGAGVGMVEMQAMQREE